MPGLGEAVQDPRHRQAGGGQLGQHVRFPADQLVPVAPVPVRLAVPAALLHHAPLERRHRRPQRQVDAALAALGQRLVRQIVRPETAPRAVLPYRGERVRAPLRLVRRIRPVVPDEHAVGRPDRPHHRAVDRGLQPPERPVPVVDVAAEPALVRDGRGRQVRGRPVQDPGRPHRLGRVPRVDGQALADLAVAVVQAGVEPAQLPEGPRRLEHDVPRGQRGRHGGQPLGRGQDPGPDVQLTARLGVGRSGVPALPPDALAGVDGQERPAELRPVLLQSGRPVEQGWHGVTLPGSRRSRSSS